MGISHVRVENFQSVKDVTVQFGKFTVVVGQSSTGKSALLRAVKSLFRNSFVPDNVRQGATKAVVTAEFDDGTTVSSERGKSLSTYHLNGEAFTKAGRSVPDAVVKAISFPLIESVDPTFSFQFDKPFLLADSGSTASAVIGSLTNVSVLLQAVREANRRRAEASAALKVRKQDLESLAAQSESFSDLPERKKTLDEASASLTKAKADNQKMTDLKRLIQMSRKADLVLQSIEVPVVPDVSARIAELDDLIATTDALKGIVKRASTNLTQARERVTLVTSTIDQMKQLEQQYASVLQEAGVCPTCGSDVRQ